MIREQAIETAVDTRDIDYQIGVMVSFKGCRQIESRLRGSSIWFIDNVPTWNWAAVEYRIKPTATLRPWTAHEVPLGAWLRYKGNQQSIRFLIVSNMERGIAGYNTHWPYQALLDEMEHSLDGGKTWKPCGVEEESK